MPNQQIFSVLRQNISAVLNNAGHTAVWRAFVSASAANAEYGLGSAHSWSNRIVTGLIENVTPQEIFAAGGTYLQGDIRMVTIEPIEKRDEVLWENNRYIVVRESDSVSLFGTALHQTVLRRG